MALIWKLFVFRLTTNNFYCVGHNSLESSQKREKE